MGVHALIARNENDGLELLSLKNAALHGNLPFEFVHRVTTCLLRTLGSSLGAHSLAVDVEVVPGRLRHLGVFVALGLEFGASGTR